MTTEELNQMYELAEAGGGTASQISERYGELWRRREAIEQKTDLMDHAKMLAEATSRRHIIDDDGEKCFNLFTFLDDLESVIGIFLDSRVPKFELDAAALARFLWCDMAMQAGDDPAGTTFRGMPILD